MCKIRLFRNLKKNKEKNTEINKTNPNDMTINELDKYIENIKQVRNGKINNAHKNFLKKYYINDKEIGIITDIKDKYITTKIFSFVSNKIENFWYPIERLETLEIISKEKFVDILTKKIFKEFNI